MTKPVKRVKRRKPLYRVTIKRVQRRKPKRKAKVILRRKKRR